ncbi:MAG: UDP-2,4-diacetamido-2,4,6-trideoxy-beta-L-altropyranose hydrolase [Burkholderiales bacterium]|nr:UDP-2,4-diacetamido-2,4,6-trideoxy-beta-L-altropyranose hydrolase [Burkholderiales bacterium]
MRVAFRVDASVEIGSGHLMRCLTLADALAHHGAASVFVCRWLDPRQQALVQSCGHRVVRLPEVPEPVASPIQPPHAAWLRCDPVLDAQHTAEVLAVERPVGLVVDHYALDAAWERVAGVHAGWLAAIDDLADRSHDVQLLLDGNAYADADTRYDRHLLRSGTARLLGPDFILLRAEFLAARAAARPADERDRLFIGFGGVDRGNQSLATVRACRDLLAGGVGADIVVGATFPGLSDLRRELESHPAYSATRLHVATDRMGALMASARLAVAGGGTSVWERMCVGLPALVLATAANQVEALRYLGQRQALHFLGEAQAVSAQDIGMRVQALWQDAPALARLAAAGQDLVDGRGAARVADALLSLAPQDRHA